MNDYPVPEPVLGRLFANDLVRQEREKGRRELAFDTPFRASDACACARKMGYDLAGVSQEPATASGLHVMAFGTEIGERIGRIAQTHYGPERCHLEEPCEIDGLVSGHADVWVKNVPDKGDVVFEIKCVGSFAFDKATGMNRPAYKRINPEGPRLSAITQGSLYAAALRADWLCVLYVSREAVSINLADGAGLTELDRFCAEWWYNRAVFGGYATRELRRLQRYCDSFDVGVPYPRECVGDQGQIVTLDPEAKRKPWQCQYCNHHQYCVEDGV